MLDKVAQHVRVDHVAHLAGRYDVQGYKINWMKKETGSVIEDFVSYAEYGSCNQLDLDFLTCNPGLVQYKAGKDPP
jgi:hypothetical protein